MRLLKFKVLMPIVFKLVFLTSGLVASVALIIAWKNADLFQQISTDREETTAELLTSSRAKEIEAIFGSYIDKLTNLAQSSKAAIALDGDLLYFKLESTDKQAPIFEKINSNDKSFNLSDYHKVLSKFQTRLFNIEDEKVLIISSANMLSEPLLIIAAPVGKSQGVVSHWAWGFFRLNKLQASFQGSKSHVVYLIDDTGKIISHPDEKKSFEAKDLSDQKVISEILRDDLRQRQQYVDNKLYSMAKTIFGPIVIGEVSRETILAPSVLAKESSYFIMGIVLSISFFLSVVFSHTLSRNIEKLTSFAYRIAGGDFDIHAQSEIKTKDEIGLLANAFDDMTLGLKERDKIKNLFTKFHGIAITEELMNQEDMRKGTKCEAVVFFSDIRGFTDFSNDKTPEEVVLMLNSYFEVMVTIINKHGGVVDKFVGDAIMAVWGAPKGTPDDAKKAVQACLEMRQALADFNKKRIEENQQPILMGMGLHAGPVVAGTVGSNARLEYTVIGDTVNTASRIESSTKSFGTDLLVSEEVAQRIGQGFILGAAGSTKVKGKDAPLKLLKVSGYIDENFNPIIISTPYSSYAAEDSEKVKVVA
jgi:adenylate cyclase